VQRSSTLHHQQEHAPVGAAAALSAPRPALSSQEGEQSQPEQCEAYPALDRKLAQLADTFPRFQAALTRLRNHVAVQVRSEAWKRQAVLECLSDEPMSVEGIIEETDLDRQNILQALVSLEKKGAAEKCNWNGRPVRIRRDGKPEEKIHWRAGSVRRD